jgi:hypothetical protein
MRERNPFILADLIRIRAEEKPDLDVLTFEHWTWSREACSRAIASRSCCATIPSSSKP